MRTSCCRDEINSGFVSTISASGKSLRPSRIPHGSNVPDAPLIGAVGRRGVGAPGRGRIYHTFSRTPSNLISRATKIFAA